MLGSAGSSKKRPSIVEARPKLLVGEQSTLKVLLRSMVITSTGCKYNGAYDRHICGFVDCQN